MTCSRIAPQARAELEQRLGDSFDLDAKPRDIERAVLSSGLPIAEQTESLNNLQRIVELMGKITAEATKQSAEGAKTAKTESERQAKVAETLADIRAEAAIERERLTGNEQLVTVLVIENKLRKEIAGLEKIDPSGKLAAEAKITAELEKQVALKMQMQEKEITKAEDAVGSAETPRQKRLAEDKLAGMKDRAELTEKGFKGEELEDQLKERRKGWRKDYEDKNRKPGQIMSYPDDNARLDYASDAIARSLGLGATALDGAGSMAGKGMPSRPYGATSPDAWNQLFPKRAPLPTSAEMFGPPAPAAGLGGGGAKTAGGGQLDKAADKQTEEAKTAGNAAEKMEKAGEKQGEAMSKIDAALGKLQTAITQSGTKIQTALESVTSAVEAQAQTIAQMEGRINALENP